MSYKTKKLYEEQTKSIYEIAKGTGINKLILYRYANGKEIGKMDCSQVMKISKYLHMDPNTLMYQMYKYQNKENK